jgi:hypothetical protein
MQILNYRTLRIFLSFSLASFQIEQTPESTLRYKQVYPFRKKRKTFECEKRTNVGIRLVRDLTGINLK